MEPTQLPNQQMVIDPGLLSETALRGIVEAFVLQEGTEYGARDYSLDEKVSTVIKQIRAGKAVIVFDTETESCNVQTVQSTPTLS